MAEAQLTQMMHEPFSVREQPVVTGDTTTVTATGKTQEFSLALVKNMAANKYGWVMSGDLICKNKR